MDEMGQGYLSNISKKQRVKPWFVNVGSGGEGRFKDIADGVLPGSDWKCWMCRGEGHGGN